MQKPFGFNVIGHVSGNLGLGVTARIVVQILLDNRIPVSIVDIDPGLRRGKRDLRFESLVVSGDDALPYAVNLAVVPPPTLVSLLSNQSYFFADPAYFNAAFTIWELPVIPASWRPTLEFFDVLVCQSAFIRQTLATTLSTPTIPARHALYVPSNIASDRLRFGLNEDDIVYVTGLELASDPMRKNVLGVVEAFERGLRDVSQARLIVRLNNAQAVPADNRVLAALRAASSRDSRIRIFTQPLDYPGVLSLYASGDVFVSLHRSEGLGLGPMEAMALGKAVVATAWSGNMEYMDNNTACLVPYALIPTTGAKGAYAPSVVGATARWADPDIDEAASWMKRLAEDRPLRLEIGNRAKAAIARFHEEAVAGTFAREIHALWEHRTYRHRIPSLEDRLEALKAAVQAARPAEADALTRLRRAASDALDRHVLWRFRASS